jgi:hypothetical protein
MKKNLRVAQCYSPHFGESKISEANGGQKIKNQDDFNAVM